MPRVLAPPPSLRRAARHGHDAGRVLAPPLRQALHLLRHAIDDRTDDAGTIARVMARVRAAGRRAD